MSVIDFLITYKSQGMKAIERIKIVLLTVILYSTFCNAQVKIGDNPTILQTSSILELEASGTRAGLKIAEVALTSITDVTTIPVVAASRGTLVWNTATAGTTPNNVTPGFYIWMGTSWEKVLSSSSGNDKNLYDGNGTLSSNRTVAMGTNTLAVTSTATSGTSHFTVDGSTLNVDAVNIRVGIGTNAPAGALDITSTTGALVPPRMNSTQRNALVNPPVGSFIFNTDLSQLQFNSGTITLPVWTSLAQSSSTLNSLHARTSTSTVNLSNNGVVPVQSLLIDNTGGVATYNTTNNTFTLLAGKTYQLEFSANFVAPISACSNFVRFRWFNVTSNSYIGVVQHFEMVTSNAVVSGGGSAFAYITPNVNTDVRIQLFSGAGGTCQCQIGDANNGGTFPSVKIMVLN